MAVVLTILLFGVVVVFHELGHFITAKINKVKINAFSIGMGPSIFSWGSGETKYFLRALPIGGYVSIDDDNFEKTPIQKRIAVILAGSLVNIISGFLVISIIVLIQGQFVSTKVKSVNLDQNKIQAGDCIKSINTHHIFGANDLIFELSKIEDDMPVNLTVLRNNEIIELNDVGYFIKDGEKSYRTLGISLDVEQLTFSNFFTTSFNKSVFVTKLVWISICDLVTGKISIDNISGPVGFTKSVSDAKNQGALSVISLFPLLSINIGIFNLLPFPALDGGRFIFLLFELIFRRKIKKSFQNYVNALGILILIFLFIVVAIKDICSFF